jgi:hypothetical protein
MQNETFSFVVAVNNHQILQANLLRSPSIAENASPPQVIIKENFSSAGAAYNSGLDDAINDLVIFIHQDMYLPADWLHKVAGAIRSLEETGQRWGVLGCYGVTAGHKLGFGQTYSTGLGVIGQPIAEPTPVDTLDEIVLILRKSSGLRFDSSVPGFHMYGPDICMEARERGLRCFAIPAFCVHNTSQLFRLPDDFRVAYRYMKRKWRRHLPIHTSCTVIERFDRDLWRQDWEQFLARVRRCQPVPMPRMDDPRIVFDGRESADGVVRPGKGILKTT